jgi:hypothetical protein
MINKQNRIFGLLVILLLLIVGLVVLVNLRTVQELRKKAVGPAPDATLTLGGVPTTPIQVLNEFWINVSLGTTGTPAYGADLQIEFDPAVLRVMQIVRGNDVGDGCGAPPPEPLVVLAPIGSETNCAFNEQAVLDTANLGGSHPGILEFGVVAFDWGNADQPGYLPVPFSTGSIHQIARIRFSATAEGISPVKFRVAAGCSSGLNCDTTDTNVAAVDSSGVGDILASVFPVGGLTVAVSGGNNQCPASLNVNTTDNVLNAGDVSTLVNLYASCTNKPLGTSSCPASLNVNTTDNVLNAGDVSTLVNLYATCIGTNF